MRGEPSYAGGEVLLRGIAPYIVVKQTGGETGFHLGFDIGGDLGGKAVGCIAVEWELVEDEVLDEKSQLGAGDEPLSQKPPFLVTGEVVEALFHEEIEELACEGEIGEGHPVFAAKADATGTPWTAAEALVPALAGLNGRHVVTDGLDHLFHQLNRERHKGRHFGNW